MRLLVAGDTHGNQKHFNKVLAAAIKHEVDAIVQVGDFGYTWPGSKALVYLEERLASAGLTMYWIDGNHDNYTDLKERGVWDRREPQVITDHVTYLPRAARWEWDGVTFMSLGGGVSIDKARRISGLSWWEEEQITHAEAKRAIDGGPVDVMFTHDCPYGVRALEKFLQTETARFGVPYKTEFASTQHRKILATVTDVVRPHLLIHGHYHHRYTAQAPWAVDGGDKGGDRVIGLARDGRGPDSWLVLDTAGWNGIGQSLVVAP